MNNCFILGFGRSGTSLMGGILYHSGYFLGDDLYPPRESNPKGFFENEFINTINESILAPYDYIKIRPGGDPIEHRSSPWNPKYGQRWLSYIEPETDIQCPSLKVEEDIGKALSKPCFAYKDPRFNYTYPVWERHFTGTVKIICLFRQPEITVESVIKDSESRYEPGEFYVNPEIVFRLWFNNYQRILRDIYTPGSADVIFIHYEQLLSSKALDHLSEVLEIPLNGDFISPDLNRSRPVGQAPDYVRGMYKHLCSLAGHPLSL